MDIMTIDISGLQTFTPADLLKLCDRAIAYIMLNGQSFSEDGFTASKADLDQLRKWRTQLQNEVAESSTGNGGLIALANFNRAQ